MCYLLSNVAGVLITAGQMSVKSLDFFFLPIETRPASLSLRWAEIMTLWQLEKKRDAAVEAEQPC